MPDISIDPEKLPADWRKVVRVGAFVILLSLGVMGLGALAASPVANARVEPAEKRIDVLEDWRTQHQAQVDQRIPQMLDFVKRAEARDRAMARNIYELCKASKAKCELIE